jgi:hypothetical protein
MILNEPTLLQEQIKNWRREHHKVPNSPIDIMVRDLFSLLGRGRTFNEGGKKGVDGKVSKRRVDLNPRECMTIRNFLIMLLEQDRKSFLEEENHESAQQHFACWLSVTIAVTCVPFRSQVFAGLERVDNQNPVTNRTVARLCIGLDNAYHILLYGDKTGLGGESPVLIPLGSSLSSYVHHFSKVIYPNDGKFGKELFPWKKSTESDNGASKPLVKYLHGLLGEDLSCFVPRFHDLRFLCINSFGRYCRFAKDQMYLAGMLTRDSVKILQDDYAYWYRLESQSVLLHGDFWMAELCSFPPENRRQWKKPPINNHEYDEPQHQTVLYEPKQKNEIDNIQSLSLNSRIPVCNNCGSGRRLFRILNMVNEIPDLKSHPCQVRCPSSTCERNPTKPSTVLIDFDIPHFLTYINLEGFLDKIPPPGEHYTTINQLYYFLKDRPTTNRREIPNGPYIHDNAFDANNSTKKKTNCKVLDKLPRRRDRRVNPNLG